VPLSVAGQLWPGPGCGPCPGPVPCSRGSGSLCPLACPSCRRLIGPHRLLVYLVGSLTDFVSLPPAAL